MHWETLRDQGRPVDRWVCERCGHLAAVEDWDLPLSPPTSTGCWNCGGSVRGAACLACGLTPEEARLVHRELRDLIDPELSMLEAAALASEAGRQCLALKLATGAMAHTDHREAARLLRLSLLQELGEFTAALADCRHWTQNEGARVSTAWAVMGEFLLASTRTGEAMDAFKKALSLDPDDHATRARLARLLYSQGRYGQARQFAQSVLGEDKGEAGALALGVLVRYAVHLYRQGDTAAVRELLGSLGDEVVDEDSSLLSLRAWLQADRGELDASRATLRAAYELDTENPLVLELKEPLGVRRWTWWSWS
jgi:tetratricopeptide (TPR) repeat protein